MTARTVFISHAHADNALCDPYDAALRKAGLDVSYDRDNMKVAGSIPQTVGDELKARTAFIIMLTPKTVKSRWVLHEIDTYLHFWLAEAERRMILPVMIQDCEPPAIPAPLKHVDAVLQTEH